MHMQVNVSEEILESTLISGFEGGSNYWYGDLISSEGKGYYFEKILGDGWVKFADQTSGKRYKLDREKVKQGLQVMAEKNPRQFHLMLTGQGDAFTGDVLIGSG